MRSEQPTPLLLRCKQRQRNVERSLRAGGHVADPAVRNRPADQGSTTVGNTPAEFKKILDEEIEKSAQLVKLSGTRVE